MARYVIKELIYGNDTFWIFNETLSILIRRKKEQ